MRGSALMAALISLGSFSVQAADTVTQAIQEAYVPYRVALLKTSSGSVQEARQALAKAAGQWNGLQSQLGGQISAPYAGDVDFGADIERVGLVYKEAGERLSANDKAGAHEALERIRDILSGMRQRNDVVVFSDHMNAYHAKMEQVLFEGPKLLEKPAGLFSLTLMAGALDFLAQRLSEGAPSPLHDDEEFRVLVGALQASVSALKTALATQNADLVRDALAGLKLPYARLFVKFG